MTHATDLQFGAFGFEHVNDTALHSTPFHGLQTLAATVIASATGLNVTGNALIGTSIPTGTYLPIQADNIPLTSGRVILYKKPTTL